MSELKHNVVNICLQNMELNPYCNHGPTILFERILSSGEIKKFYACSASRDRKECSFYLEEEKVKKHDKKDSLIKEFQLRKEHVLKFKKFVKYSKLIDSKNIFFCENCDNLYSDKPEDHSSCDVHKILSKQQIGFPSQMFSPKSNSKFAAQYFFAEKSLQVIIKSIQDLGIEKVLCIGAPSVFEFIKNNLNIKAFLLDIDNRYCNFFSSKEFCLYNMFNHYFLCSSKSKEFYKNFIKSTDKILLLIDPPFGGRMELISNTIQIIEKEWRYENNFSDNKTLPSLLIFPYFLEKSVKINLPSFSMLEYQVNYMNHGSYSKGPRGMKHGSAVRMFTNQSPHLFAFPEEDGYKFCNECKRWVHPQNIHCLKCGNCTSKDGRTYIHCDLCEICVKPAWTHCDTCNRCLPKDHHCKSNFETEVITKDHESNSTYSIKRKRENYSKDLKKSKKNKMPLTRKEEKSRDLSILQQILDKK